MSLFEKLFEQAQKRFRVFTLDFFLFILNNMRRNNIPQITVQRIAMYVQVLEELVEKGECIVSSDVLAKECGLKPSQIRKDLSYFGEFGVRGVGYYTKDLLTTIKHFLCIDKKWNCALVGVGNLGKALLRYRLFRKKGFEIVAIFDCDPFKIGETVGEYEIFCLKRLKEKAKELNIEIGIITTSPKCAQRAANAIVEAGIKGIINFAPVRLKVPEEVKIDYVDLSVHLMTMAFNLVQNNGGRR